MPPRRPSTVSDEVLQGYETLAKQTARTVGSQLGRQILRGVLGGILGGARRR